MVWGWIFSPQFGKMCVSAPTNFHLPKNIGYFPLLVLQGIEHYWKYLHFSQKLKQMEANSSTPWRQSHRWEALHGRVTGHAGLRVALDPCPAGHAGPFCAPCPVGRFADQNGDLAAFAKLPKRPVDTCYRKFYRKSVFLLWSIEHVLRKFILRFRPTKRGLVNHLHGIIGMPHCGRPFLLITGSALLSLFGMRSCGTVSPETKYLPFQALPGLLKDTFCPFETWLFPPKMLGSHHL